ncbi:MAG: 4-(cytidine 5'-diphospho)-2-C-methyl-D-erythritol kinase [Clostridia bacterium]|nr:4-(cytidine 5'-diphospho)-2-C-methyl-D-erythritol kinase [Clostridia bacterium]
MVWTEKAYAKINLFLEITGRRPDGYHTLTTVMQSVTLADTLSAEKTADGKGKITLSVQGADLGPCTDNLVFRAADLFLKRTGTADSWSFELTKDIPVSAGLAGGSADAGAVLRLLSRAYPGALSPEECLQLGAQLGADVPFCFLQGRALCLGVGDEVHPLPVTKANLLLVCPPYPVSTPSAYAALDRLHDGFSSPVFDTGDPGKLLRSFETDNPEEFVFGLFNRFEEVTGGPEEKAVRKRLEQSGALGTLLSGSGPSFAAFFAPDVSDSYLEERASEVRKMGWFCRVCRFYDPKSPE